MAATTASHTHVRKRPYQPSISSYFNRRASDQISSSQPERSASPWSPPLPAETQASLLSVGMRVRKSVPEGYKTHKTLGTQEIGFPSAAARVAALRPPRMTEGRDTTGTRELVPFCGLHKIGGLGAQEMPSSSAPAVMRRDGDEDGVPGLSFSQATLDSTPNGFVLEPVALADSSRKRGYDEEIEEDLDAFFDGLDGDDESRVSEEISRRPIAKMRGGRKVEQAGPSILADDFEEAPFLSPVDGMDVDER